MGPFHNTVPAARISAANVSAVRPPMSTIISLGATSSTPHVRAGASLLRSVVTTTSVGRTILPPRPSRSRAVSTRSASSRLRPTSRPWALRKVLAMPPPISSRSTRSIRFCSTASFDDTLAPPTTATNGRRGFSRAWPIVTISFSIRRPATAGRWWARPSVDACAR